MYKFVLIELRRLRLPNEQIYLSLERHMKCGVGKCGHCQINGHYVCQEGPVFRYADVARVREAI
jgi:NAD(P)H-flavin reductase